MIYMKIMMHKKSKEPEEMTITRGKYENDRISSNNYEIIFFINLYEIYIIRVRSTLSIFLRYRNSFSSIHGGENVWGRDLVAN